MAELEKLDLLRVTSRVRLNDRASAMLIHKKEVEYLRLGRELPAEVLLNVSFKIFGIRRYAQARL